MRLARRLLLAVWAGALLAVGGLAAPTLFAVLPERRLAGLVAGELFRRMTLVSVAASLMVALLALWPTPAADGRRAAAWALLPGGLLLASAFGVHPLLAAARIVGVGGAATFAAWHGLASALYVAASAIVVGLLVGELRR